MPHGWDQVKEILASALELRPEERTQFVRQASGGDQALLAEVESLLAHHDQADSFLEDSPAARWQAIDPAAWTGKRIGAYKIAGQKRRGAWRWFIWANETTRNSASASPSKCYGPDFTAEIVHRFRNERQTLAALDHPNIVNCSMAATPTSRLPFLVMDYVEGSPIDEYCELNELPARSRLQLFLSVCAAVLYAHRNSVIHRDLKPANILITKDGVPRLLDFGIAKLLNTELLQTPLVTRTEWRPMTLEYASPEQVRGEPVTEASDIYSLGVLLYELLAGCRPYDTAGHSRVEVERMICEQEPERPSAALKETGRRRPGFAELRRALTRDLDTVMMKALRKEAERRYGSVEELAQDIERYLKGMPVRARKPTVAYRGAKFLHRHQESLVVFRGSGDHRNAGGDRLFLLPPPKPQPHG